MRLQRPRIIITQFFAFIALTNAVSLLNRICDACGKNPTRLVGSDKDLGESSSTTTFPLPQHNDPPPGPVRIRSMPRDELPEQDDNEGFSPVERYVDDDRRQYPSSLQQFWQNLHDVLPEEIIKTFQLPRDLSAHDPPFRAEGRYVLDLQGRRVKFACVNWPSDGITLLPEGLTQYTVEQLARRARLLGFNCVRYVISTSLLEHLDQPVIEVMQKVFYDDRRQLESLIKRITRQNPSINSQTIMQVFESAIKALANQRLFVMIAVRPHLSTIPPIPPRLRSVDFYQPQHSASSEFNIDRWLNRLEFLSNLIKERSWWNVVGVSITPDFSSGKSAVRWLQRMRWAALVVAAQNPFLLISIAGIKNGLDLSPLTTQQFITQKMLQQAPQLPRRLMFELHVNADNFISSVLSSFPSPVTPLMDYQNSQQRQQQGESSYSSSSQSSSHSSSSSADYIMNIPFDGSGNTRRKCRGIITELERHGGFLLRETSQITAPMWLSEFGVDIEVYNRRTEKNHPTSGDSLDSETEVHEDGGDGKDIPTNDSDLTKEEHQRNLLMKPWFDCMILWMESKDLDMAYWALNSIYYSSNPPINTARPSWGLLAAGGGGHSYIKNQKILDALHPAMLLNEGPGVDGSRLFQTDKYDLKEFLAREQQRSQPTHDGEGVDGELHQHSIYRNYQR